MMDRRRVGIGIAGCVEIAFRAKSRNPSAVSPVYRSAAEAPESLVIKDEIPFSTAFRDANGSDADANVVTGYIAARFIDAAVSAVQGEFSRREAMDRGLEQTRQHLP